MESLYRPAMLELELAIPLMYSGEVKSAIEDYIEMVGTHNANEGRKAEAEFDRALKGHPEEYHGQVEDYFIELLERHRSMYPQLLYESIFIMIYKHLERSLKQAVEIIYRVPDRDARPIPEYRSNIINNYFAVIKLFCLTPPSNARWEEIRHYQQLRNKMVHNKPHVEISKEQVLAFNVAVMEFLHIIYRNLKIPVENPNRAILDRPLDSWPSQVPS